ncbi:MAG: chromosome partitioning ATPase, partial [Burkholderiaceae bacterium]
MSVIEQATRRLEELSRAGVAVPWAAAGLTQSDLKARVEANRNPLRTEPTLAAAVRRFDEGAVSPGGTAGMPGRVAAEKVDGPADVTLDLEQLETSGRIVPTHTRSAQSEQFRQLKRPLLKNARSPESAANRLSLIMVTSSLPGEGKTFCAINLAMSIAAEIDTSVLLVDADVMRPEVLNRLGIQATRKGLLDVLTAPDPDLSEVILKT